MKRQEPVNAQKGRTGLSRMTHAFGYSLAGLRAGWGETAFRQEAIAAVVMLPLAFWLGRNWVEVAMLAGSVVLVMVVELLNTGVESAIGVARSFQARQRHGQRGRAAQPAGVCRHLGRGTVVAPVVSRPIRTP